MGMALKEAIRVLEEIQARSRGAAEVTFKGQGYEELKSAIDTVLRELSNSIIH